MNVIPKDTGLFFANILLQVGLCVYSFLFIFVFL